jgi:hypothetical protein
MNSEETLIEKTRKDFTRKLLSTLIDLHEKIFLKQVELRDNADDPETKYLIEQLPELKKRAQEIKSSMVLLIGVIQMMGLIDKGREAFKVVGGTKMFEEIYDEWKKENEEFLKEVHMVSNIEGVNFRKWCQ